MKYILLVAAAISISEVIDLRNKLSFYSSIGQKICIEILPSSTEKNQSLSALVCGEKVTATPVQKDLQESGLIHIFVVSGGHLLVLVEVFKRLRWPFFLQVFVLMGFTLFTGWQAPCVRSLMQLLLNTYNSQSRCHWRPDQVVLLSGLLTLAFFPNWMDSLSLQLSWMAALALSLIPNSSAGPQSFWLKSLCVYLLIHPLLWKISSLHPLSILWNMTMGPILAFFLFPLAVLSCLNTWILQIFEFFMSYFWQVLSWGRGFTPPAELRTWDSFFIFLWIFGVHLLGHGVLVFYYRKNRT